MYCKEGYSRLEHFTFLVCCMNTVRWLDVASGNIALTVKNVWFLIA